MKTLTRNKILYIPGGFPWPLDSGINIRRYQILRSLANFGEVDLLAIPRFKADVPLQIKELCKRIYVYPRISSQLDSKNTLSRFVQVYRELQGWPLEEKSPDDDQLNPHIVDVLNNKYDLIWISRLETALRIAHKGGDNVILDLDDIEHLKIKQSSKLSNNPIKKLRLWVSSRAWRINEFNALNKFACVAVCSNKDKQYLGHLNKIAVLPNGTSISPDIQFNPGITGRMLYVGRMDYEPNNDAVCYFANEILPRISSHVSGSHLIIVGPNPSKRLLKINDTKNVHVIGKVDDIAPYLRDSVLSVVPLRTGGGTRLKILEALAHKNPVVSTTIGAEGLELENGKHILISDGPQAFADSCITLLENQALCRQLGENGYARVCDLYSWEHISNYISDIVNSIVNH